MPVFMATLFTVVKGRNNPHIHQQMKKQNVIYANNRILFNYKKDEDVVHTTIHMSLENIMLSKVTQEQRANSVYFQLMTYLDLVKFVETETRLGVTRG